MLILCTTLLAPALALSADPTRGEGQPHFKVTWVGGPTMLIEFGDFTVLTDPTLGDAFLMGDPNDKVDHKTTRTHRRLTPLTQIDLKAVDPLLLSHIHEDHLDQKASDTLNRSLPVVAPIGDVQAMRGKGFKKVRALRWGEARRFNAGAGSVEIRAIPARHSQDPAIAAALGKGNGYWIEFRRGTWKRTMYWTGDTMPTDDVIRAVKSRGKPDLMVPHVGGVGPADGPLGPVTMRAADVVSFATSIQPRYVLPIHHSTYAFYLEPISELASQSTGKPYRLDIIRAGSIAIYE